MAKEVKELLVHTTRASEKEIVDLAPSAVAVGDHMAPLSKGVGWPYLGLRKKGRGVNDPLPVIK